MTIGIVQISLRESTLAELFAHKAYDSETADDIICRLLTKLEEAERAEFLDRLFLDPSTNIAVKDDVESDSAPDSPKIAPAAVKMRERPIRPEISVSPAEPKEIGSNYVLTFLGHQVNGENLWWPYAQLVDLLDSIAPDVLTKLSEDGGGASVGMFHAIEI